MNCNGHISISEEAFQQVFRKCGATNSCDPRYAQSNLNQYEGLYSGIDYKGAACVALAAKSLYAAQAVAAVDANLFSHFKESMQRYHFMAAPNESEVEACRLGIAFIQQQTAQFIQECSAVLRAMPTPRGVGDFYTFTDQFGVRRSMTSVYGTGTERSIIVTHPFAARPFFNPAHLARALHCLQDSFSTGHARRGAGLQIDRIYIYSEQDHEQHSREDNATGLDKSNSFRSAAVEASAALIELSLRAALRMEIAPTEWPVFADKWLRQGNLSVNPPPKKTNSNQIPAERFNGLFYTEPAFHDQI